MSRKFKVNPKDGNDGIVSSKNQYVYFLESKERDPGDSFNII